MKFDILTVFPEYFSVLSTSLLGKAIEEGKFAVDVINIRDFSTDKHRHTDDAPYGGGAGMVMTCPPTISAIEHADPDHEAVRIYMSPKGRTLDQSLVEQLAKKDRILLLCGDYEGIDERIIDLAIDEEVSIGDYVLTGGELPALVLVNAVARYISGVLGCEQSTDEESFSNGLLEYPHYTRPENFRGLKVPDVLLGGDHSEIAEWRLNKSLEITAKRRPDLLAKLDITPFLPKKKRKKRT